MGFWKKSDVPALKAAYPRMAKWPDSKVLRVCNRARRIQERQLARKSRKQQRREQKRKHGR